MSQTNYLSTYPVPLPVAIWIKKPWQTPQLTYISISSIATMAINKGHAHHFGLHSALALKNRRQQRGNIKSLLTPPSAGFTTLSKKSIKSTSQSTIYYLSISKSRSYIGPLRFIAYSVTSVLLLPLFLINGRENTKLNKVPHSDGSLES